MTRITAYGDRWTASPGESIRFMADVDGAGYIEASLCRLASPEAGQEQPLLSTLDGRHAAGRQHVQAGSYVIIPDGGRFPAVEGLGIAIWVWPTVDGVEQGLMAKRDGGTGAGFALGIDDAGRPYASFGRTRLTAPRPLPLRQWSLVTASYDPNSGRASVAANGAGAEAVVPQPVLLTVPASLLIGALPGNDTAPRRHFRGRLEAPVLSRTPVPASAFQSADALARLPGLIAAWDFAREPGGDDIRDIGSHCFDGKAVNLPTRAVRGRLWNGDGMRWTERPEEYGAIHFHAEDLYDAGWTPTCSFEVPQDLPSGVYAARLAADDAEEFVPFFVPARHPGRAAKLAFWLPTYTYLAYANDHCLLYGANPEVLAQRLIELHPGDLTLAKHPEFGLSLYDTHEDGSGVAYSSRLRPVLTLRHRQRSWQGGLPGECWNFAADMQTLAWLEGAGFKYEIITDEQVDREGAGLLTTYRAVMTGSHPEYLTRAMHDALRAFLDGGGRLAYFGGNGFYWRVATSGAWPAAIELRRAEDGNRSWAAEPGEYYHAFDGSYGGLWRRNGRPPQALVGVGYTAQGFIRSRPFRRTSASYDPRVAFAFDGIGADALIGAAGANGGAAGGIEIDRADSLLGTPPHALVVGTADGFDDSYLLANEEILVNRPTVAGELSPLIRADMVFFETSGQGAVFSVGSIAWAGALRTDAAACRLSGNVLRRFLDPAPFSTPNRSYGAEG